MKIKTGCIQGILTKDNKQEHGVGVGSFSRF